MRIIVLCIILLTASVSDAQVQLDSKSLSNLVAISELYSNNPNLTDVAFAKTIDSLRTRQLDRVVDTLVAVRKQDATILETRFLKRPSDEDLYLWYVIREIHYNNATEVGKPRPSIEVANETLSKKIDSRWLLDNYYYRIRGGIAAYFNQADLSKHDLKMGELGLKDKTERAIFFLNMMESLAGGRFMVLMMTKNNKKILEFSHRFPKFDGKEYYFFKEFDYLDFDWIGYEKLESYNRRHIDRFYVTLLAHHAAERGSGDAKTAEQIFRNSILNDPKYFKFSDAKDSLQALYESSR